MTDTLSAVELLAGAHMIGADAPRGQAIGLTCDVELEGPASAVTSARLVSTAHGIYEARVNGVSVDDAVLNPGWTAYEWRLAVQEADVTDLVRAGGRAAKIEVLLGNGWWRGELGFDLMKIDYGEELGFIGALEIVYADGSRQVAVTAADGTAHACATPITENSLYNGETIDARIDPAEHPLEVREVAFDRSTLYAQTMPPVRRTETLRPVRIWQSPAGKTLVDFGQNIVGWVRVRVSGPRGTEVVVRHAEVLEHEELGTRPLRAAKATDTFILSGGEDVFEPTLTFHGFRYAVVTGWPGELAADDIISRLWPSAPTCRARVGSRARTMT